MTSLGVFTGILVLSFGASVLLAGLFTAYFGAGKSRKIGLGLTLTGLVTLAFFVSGTWKVAPGVELDVWTSQDIVTGLAAVGGALLGSIVAITAFLVSIMKA